MTVRRFLTVRNTLCAIGGIGTVVLIAFAGGLWAVFENMSEMGIALTADDLLSNHAATVVLDSPYRIAGERQPETWPARSRIILVRRRKQLGIATNAAIRPVFLVIDVRARERPFSALVLGHLKLLVRQFGT